MKMKRMRKAMRRTRVVQSAGTRHGEGREIGGAKRNPGLNSRSDDISMTFLSKHTCPRCGSLHRIIYPYRDDPTSRCSVCGL